MAGRLPSPFPPSSSHALLRVSTIATTTTDLRMSTFPFFGIFLASRGLWGSVRLTALYYLTLLLSLVRLPLCERGSFFSPIAFGYRGINYPLVLPVHYLPSCIYPLEIVQGKRIPFSPIRTLRTREFLDPLHVPLPFGGSEVSIIPCIAFWYFSFT